MSFATTTHSEISAMSSTQDVRNAGVVLDSPVLTHLSLGDVRSVHESLDEMLNQAAEGDIECMFDLHDKIETMRDILDNVLCRHRVVTVERIGECIEKRTEVIL